MIKKILKFIIRIMDYIFHKKEKCVLLPYCENDYFFISIHSYNGQEKYLEDGTVIKSGDKIIEIHMNNQKSKEFSEIKAILKSMKQMLPAMAKTLYLDDRFKEAKAVYGNTLLYSIAVKYGFEVKDIEQKDNNKFANIWENIIKYAYSDSGKKMQNKQPKEIWFSKDALIKRWLEE